ncbi:hypothetical protein AK812_SmicGene13757 [Symbiodinium microadriaticum]|uniref:Integrase catalytic domain-containing protein n=1 Tax=Symbiodinium microadriaticum TaxID=2951 RepID=A0A1Q9E7B0_SYMMI|nr:hypothetical protein AK812_SmicGene13757 [Symbiodinium microadriaticum]CAE7362790.1 unnamed protein product [Symbiodinium sp. KB8]
MEASAGSDGQQQQEPVMEPAEQDLQLDQAEPDVDSQARSQPRMTEDEILEPPYGEPESLGPSVASVSPGQQGEALPEVVSQEPRGEEVLASLRPAEGCWSLPHVFMSLWCVSAIRVARLLELSVELFTNAELPSETLCDVPSFVPGATLWSGCVQEAISVVVRSAVELQTGMLSRATAFRAAGAKVDASFRQHLAQDHIPWRRDCRHCVEGGIQSRMHRRIKTPEGFVLSVDLLGKYERGVSEHHPKVVWCLVGCYTVPELSVGPQQDQVTAQDSRQDVSGEAEAPDLPSDVDCDEHAPSLPGEPLLDEDLDGLWAHEEEGPMDWEQAEEDSREFVCAADAELREEEIMSREWADQEKEHLRTSRMYELPFIVPLPNKREETVLDGIAFMITQIQALGYCVGADSDRGREFCNKRLRSFLRHRGIFKTTSEGDHYQQNGRVEGMINRIKRQARVLMTAASVEHQYWPFALQHVAARMRLMITTTLLTEVMDPAESVPSEKGDMQPLRRDLPIDERPVPIISHRIPTKRTVRTVREVSPVLQEEDAEALRLVRNPGTSIQELRDHVLGSRWMRTARPRSRGFVALLSRLVKECAPEARQAGFQLPREAPSATKQDYDGVEREPTVQVEELGVLAPLKKECPRVAKLDANNRADVAMQTPVWRQRFAVLNDEQAEQARRRGVRRPRSEWREIRVGHNYGDLDHVRNSPLSAFVLSMYLARNRSWQDSPELEVIWEGYENPAPWLFGFQPYHLTENNTQFELDRLGEVHSMVRIGYEDAPNLHGYLFRASFGNEGPKWYFIESMMTMEDRFLSAAPHRGWLR